MLVCCNLLSQTINWATVVTVLCVHIYHKCYMHPPMTIACISPFGYLLVKQGIAILLLLFLLYKTNNTVSLITTLEMAEVLVMPV